MGVTDIVFMYCSTCQRYTAHETDWDSEAPNTLWEQCLEHKNHNYDRKIRITGLEGEIHVQQHEALEREATASV